MGHLSLANVTSALSDEALQLILLPTEKCNFRCVYCYESFQRGAMPLRVVDGVKNLLSARINTLRYLAISWFGGEPLLALDVIGSVSDHVRSLLLSHPMVRYKASITTNAYLLTPDVFRQLLDWRVFTYQISFDGPQEDHDRKRVLSTGKPTYDRLWKHMMEMKQFPDRFAVTVRLHVDCDNLDHVPAFLRQFKQEFGNDSRFRLFAIALSQYDNSPRKNLNLLPMNESNGIMNDIRRQVQSMHIRARVMDLEDHDLSPICFAAKLNSFIIRSDGQVSKCIVALDNDANHVGTIDETGTFEFDRTKLLAWARGLSSCVPAELQCPFNGLGNSYRPAG
jgi:uncharacterized protein